MTSRQEVDDFYGALLHDDAEALYERAPCGYLSTAPDGTIVKINQTLLTWTGYQRGDLVGHRTFAELLTAGGRIYHETHYAPMLQMQGTAREIALEIVGADGRRLPALVNSVLERDSTGAPVVIRTVVFDATERRGYERELLAAKQRAEESEAHARALVRALQQTLVPAAPPDVDGLDIAAVYRPAGSGDEIGGDFYDVFELGAGEWVVAVGDVQGKGIEAAVVTALVRSTIRAACVRMPLPSDVLGAVNQALLRHETERFCTVALLRLRQSAEAWKITCSSGGHPLPVLIRAGAAPVVLGRPGVLLGAIDAPGFHDAQVVLQDGDAVVVYTDGVTEGRQGDDWFGESGLNAAIAKAGASAQALTDQILHDVLEFQHHFPRDDIAVVAVRAP